MHLLLFATIVAGLWIDQAFAAGQWAVNLAAWLVLAALWRSSTREERPALLACLLIATAGEVFLSLVWGLYDYREGNIPLFVPPGHVLLFWLGTRIAARLPARSEWLVPVVSLPVVAWLAFTGRDTFGPLLFALFVACMAAGGCTRPCSRCRSRWRSTARGWGTGPGARRCRGWGWPPPTRRWRRAPSTACSTCWW
jgi:hypothetical protein